MKTVPPLGASYRLQFNRGFGFADAAALTPYLHALGITHIYASPILKARAGSPHGYDIVDHNAINPELGDAAGFAAFVGTLHLHGMGLILDIVPNHMGVGKDNHWWLDVLENGEASPYAAYFDIDWHPANTALHNKVLLPLLGDHYGAVLERGELELAFDPHQGTFEVRYFEHCVPLDPRTYPHILDRARELAQLQTGIDDESLAALDGLIADCKSLPARTVPSAARREARLAGAAACKLRLAELCGRHAVIRVCIERSVTRCNGMPDDPDSFDALHRLLEAQAYRLAY
ncbi:MAG TPA: alpha-amylase family glycosyl hydrolase, partial [Gammaproteobacteria bacterium]